MKYLTSLFFFLFSCVATLNAQTERSMLPYADSTFYSEHNTIVKDTILTLRQTLNYDNPKIIDEEFTHILELTFPNTKAVKEGCVLNLSTDTLMVKANYDLSSVWNWEKENTNINGSIQIVEWKRRKVVIKEDILVEDKRRGRKLKYLGTIIFRRGSK